MLEAAIEDFLQANIFVDLAQGRPGWDLPHTKAVVHYMHEIIANSPELGLDAEVLLIAAYAHDWGYVGLFQSGKIANWEEVMDAKKQHMIKGAERIADLLKNEIFRNLSAGRKARIAHLVGKHDKLKELSDKDELVLMEADTLGGLDIERVAPTFNRRSGLNYLQGVRKARLPKFITNYGRSKARELLVKAEKHYHDLEG